ARRIVSAAGLGPAAACATPLTTGGRRAVLSRFDPDAACGLIRGLRVTSGTGFSRMLTPASGRLGPTDASTDPRRPAMHSRRDFIATASLAATGFALAPLAACSQERPNGAAPVPREKPAGATADIAPLGG